MDTNITTQVMDTNITTQDIEDAKKREPELTEETKTFANVYCYECTQCYGKIFIAKT